jgi:hypothetical protein
MRIMPFLITKTYFANIRFDLTNTGDFRFMRIDLYSVNGTTKFGEMIFYPGCGMEQFKPKHYNKTFGDLISLTREVA